MIQELEASAAVKLSSCIAIEHAILHHLDPEGKGMGEQLVASELDFTGDDGPVVRERLERFLQKSYAACEISAESLEDIDPDDGSTTLGICWRTIEDPSDFIPASWKLAQRLTEAMKTRANISEGDLLLVVARDVLGPMIAILKLEKWVELVREFVPQEDGTIKAVVVPNPNVIHTRTVPQKCAFIRRPEHKYGSYVRLNDTQARERDHAAHFFVEHFLLCRLITTTARRTIDFCVAAESWRQEFALYLPKQGLVTFAKALQLHLSKPELSFDEFAREATAGAHLTETAFEILVDQLAKSVTPTEPSLVSPPTPPRTFKPDADAVEHLLKDMILVLSDGTKVSGSSKNMMHKLESLVVDREEGTRKLTIPLQTTSVTRKFPGSSVVKRQETDDPQTDQMENAQ